MKVSDDYSFKTSYPRSVQKLLSIRQRMYFFNKNVRKYGKVKNLPLKPIFLLQSFIPHFTDGYLSLLINVLSDGVELSCSAIMFYY